MMWINKQALMACLLATACVAGNAKADVPFASAVDAAVRNYNRATAKVATGGAPSAAAMAKLKAAGIEHLVDFRTEGEGIAETKAAAEAAGLSYSSLPLGRGRPGQALVEDFAQIMKQHQEDDVYLFCASGNRAGTVWAYYRKQQGVPVEIAIEEGRAAGMAASREAWLKQ
jgi:uncharacterized protein (TIGR01244 family)